MGGIMKQFNIQQAKTHLSDLIVRSVQGEEIIIARAGEPAVRLLPINEPAERTFGQMAFEVPENFDAPLPEEELATWE